MNRKNAATATRRWLGISASLAAMLVSAGALAQDAGTAAEPDRLRGIIEPVVAKEPFTIGASLVHLQDDFWKGIAYGMVDEAARSNVEILQVSVAGAYGNVREQFGQLETLQSLGADVVVVGAAAFDGYGPILKRLRDAGITVIAAGIPVGSENVDFGVGQDDRAIGVAQGNEACRVAGTEPTTALVVPGPAGAEWANQRIQGFSDTVTADCPNLTLIQGAVGTSMALEQGLTQASDMLLRNPEATLIETPAVSLGMGAAQAVRQQGRDDVKVITSGAVNEVIPMIEDGRVLALASEPGIIMGRMIVQYAIRQHEGLPMPGMDQATGTAYPALMIPITMITPETVATYPFDLYEIPPADWSIEALQ